MELTLHWFWIIKLLITLVVLGSMWKAVIHRFKNKIWNVIAITLIILSFVVPVKIQSTTSNIHKVMDKQINNRHTELPPIQKGTSVKERSSTFGITKNDLK